MNELQELSAYIEQEMNHLNLPQTPVNLYDPLRYFLKLGGKRIRPILTLLGAELFGTPREKAIHASLAIEYFHNFSLIHDDIMDEAPLRRKQPTIHTKWNTNIAILSGDVLLVKAYQELGKQEARHLADLLAVFNRTAVEVCEGQQMDMDFERRNDTQIDEYIEMIRLKTSVLLGCALELGAIAADANPQQRSLIYSYGVNLGIAFQIQDDLLDLYADPDQFGKQVGGDLIANKKTILHFKALELGEAMHHTRLETLMAQADKALKVHQAKELFDQIGVKSEVLKLRDSYYEKAIQAMQQIDVPQERKAPLFGLLEYLKERQA